MLLRESRRFIRKSKTITISGICVLSVGLGASALVFTCLLALTVPKLPGMRVMSYATIAEASQGGGSERITWHRYERIHTSIEPGMHLAAYSRAIHLNAHIDGRDMNVRVASVSQGFWGTFTPSLTAGRDFYTNEEVFCQHRVLVLSRQSAAGLFSSPSNAIGQTITLNGQAYEIIGVGPTSFVGIFDQPVDGWVPPACLLSLSSLDGPPEQYDPDIWRKIAWFYVVAGERTLQSSSFIKELGRILPGAENAEAPLHISVGLTYDPVRDERLLRWLRLGYLFTVTFTLMTGMNYAIHLLARAPSQSDDIRLKKALGASLGRMLTELMIGPSMMVAVGTFLAWMICFGGLVALSRLFTVAKDIFASAWPDALISCGVVTIFSALLTVLIAFVPAISVLQRGQGSLTSKHTATDRGNTVLLLDSIVTVQIVLCVIMAIVAGMIATSVIHLLRTPLGFETVQLSVIALDQQDTNGMTVYLDTSHSDTSSFPNSSAIREVLRKLANLPAVKAVGYSDNVPLQDDPLPSVGVQLADGAPPKTYTVGKSIVTQGFFTAMGIRSLQGQSFPKDESRATNQVVINRSLAEELSPQGFLVGKTIRIIHPPASGISSFTEMATIIGVVGDIKQNGPASSVEPTVYQCAFGLNFFHSSPYLVVKGIEPQNVPRHDIEKSIAALMPGLKVRDVFSLQDQVHESMMPEEERAGAVMALAILISLLALLGLGGSLSFYIATRRRDLAVRICFGATAWSIRLIVMRRAAVCGGIATLLSMLTWPILAQLSSSNYLGRASWSYTWAIASSFLCFMFVIGLSMIPANVATQTPPSELLKDY